MTQPNFSLAEQEYRQLALFFEEHLQEAVHHVQQVFEQLEKINSVARYDIVIEQTNRFAQHYTSDFSNDMKGLFENWRNEASSINQFILQVEAAREQQDESLQAAKRLENDMEQQLAHKLAIEMPQYTGSRLVSLTEYGGKNKLFTDIEQVLQSFTEQMMTVYDQASATAKQRSESNQIYVNVQAILGSILTAYRAYFEAFRTGVAENLSQHISTSHQTAMDHIEEETVQLKRTAEDAGEMLKSISSLFQL